MIDILAQPSTAVFSPDRVYRYALVRHVRDEDDDDANPATTTALWIMLNPSTADEHVNDPTISRVIGHTRRMGCKRLIVCNLYALRATNPAELRGHPDPVGPRNNDWIMRAADRSAFVVCAWGASLPPGGERRARRVLNLIGDEGLTMPMALGLTKGGHPRHPLYCRSDTPPAFVDLT